MKKNPLGQENRVRAILARHHIQTDDDIDALDPSSSCINELYEEYVNSGVMPYGVAKARTGDPMNWILERIRPVAEVERLLKIAFVPVEEGSQ